MSVPVTPQVCIDGLMRETGSSDAEEAMRVKAREMIARYAEDFGEPSMPLCMETLASFIGIAKCDSSPRHSEDAELVPDGAGGMKYRVNADKPETRQRFSIAHEICHTFFPDYAHKVWCRTDARFRSRDNPDEFLEMLCDIGAAELLMPLPWFSSDAATVKTGQGLIDLADKYRASREATLRRFAETHSESLAAVYFSWKLKPVQARSMPGPDQANLFGLDPDEEARLSRKLRIDYSIPSIAFQNSGHYLPGDKSVENTGPLYEAASTGEPAEGECELSLGQSAGTYHVCAVSLWTPAEELGPNGENAVAAIVVPLKVRSKRKNRKTDAALSSLFDGSGG